MPFCSSWTVSHVRHHASLLYVTMSTTSDHSEMRRRSGRRKIGHENVNWLVKDNWGFVNPRPVDIQTIDHRKGLNVHVGRLHAKCMLKLGTGEHFSYTG